MLDLALVMGFAEPIVHGTTIVRVIHALTSGHTVPALALISSVVQMTWLQLGGRAVPSSCRRAIALQAGIGLCAAFAGLPPGSRLAASLLARAARSAMSSEHWRSYCSLKRTALAPTSVPAPGAQET